MKTGTFVDLDKNMNNVYVGDTIRDKDGNTYRIDQYGMALTPDDGKGFKKLRLNDLKPFEVVPKPETAKPAPECKPILVKDDRHFDLVRDVKTGREFLAEYSSEAAEWYEKGTGAAYSITSVEIVKNKPAPEVDRQKLMRDALEILTDADLAAELRARGYEVKATKTTIIEL